jgi:uncharacterized GH25 family protein
MMKHRTVFRVAVALLLLAIPAFSHDYWFEPDTFFAPEGGRVRLRLLVGEALKSQEERPLQKERTPRFQMISAGREPEDLLAQGKDGQVPVASVTLASAGNYLIAMERNAQPITLKAKQFTKYLKEEGLDSIIALRERSGESRKPGRERYSRCLKALLQVGDRHDDTYGRILGQKLEIVPQSNPYGLKAGDTLEVRILFDGKPLAGARVFADNRHEGKILGQTMRTSSDGLVSFKLHTPGEWVIRLVHMRRCERCDDADWESFWGSYSFGMRPAS